MKTKILLFFVLLCTTVLSSCNKDEEPTFDYPLETLYGTWNGTDIMIDGEWKDITTYPYTELGFSIRFNSDNTYSGSGYFGNGQGTYTAEGKTIITYVNGQEYARYTVNSLSNNQSELTMAMGTSTLDIRVKKQ